MKELYQFTYQYYVVLIGIGAFVLALLALRTGNKKTGAVMAIIISGIAIALFFIRIWRLFV